MKIRSPILLALGISLLSYCFDFLAVYEVERCYTAGECGIVYLAVSSSAFFLSRWIIAYAGIKAILMAIR